MSQTTPAVDQLFLAFQDAVAGRYSIDRELGRGGMGIVYLAREVHLDRLVAMKLLPPEKAAELSLRERFLREARLAAKLSHPNIIPIHAVEERGGFVYYVMAYVDGETLAQRVRTRGPLPASEGARVLREVAWALAYAHSQGLVHRDVKPDNILLEGASGRVLVADFGIAAAAGAAQAEGVSGTPEFMSPEQVLGKEIDARSDLYGLGATAFYAFSGRFPFEGKSATEILAKQVTEPPPPLSSLGLSVPRKLASLVDRCLAKEADHRPASAQALAEQLGVALEQRRELPAALRNFVKRNARLNGGGTLIAGATLLVASIQVSSYFGAIAGFTTFAFGVTAAPMAYMIGAARRLLRVGFGHTDLGPAFKGEIEQAHEELSAERRIQRSPLEKWLRRAAKLSAGVFATSIAIIIIESLIGFTHTEAWVSLSRGERQIYWQLMNLASLSAVFAFTASVFTSIGFLALKQRDRDVDAEFWARVWASRVGKVAFAVARKLLGKGAVVTAMTHRATELSLGMAAEQLYDGLPKETRQALGDLPGMLRRLQDDAQALRARYDALQEALGDAGDAASSADYAEVRETRDAIHAKLGDAVAALETIRLNLLRLHAGSTTVEGFTTHLGLAEDVSEEVERLIAGQRQVEQMLKFPRPMATTPV